MICAACGGDGYYKGPRLGDEPCPECRGEGRVGSMTASEVRAAANHYRITSPEAVHLLAALDAGADAAERLEKIRKLCDVTDTECALRSDDDYYAGQVEGRHALALDIRAILDAGKERS